MLIIILLTLLGVALLFWLVFGINWRSKQNYDRKHHLLRSRMQAEDTEELRRLLFSNSFTMRVEQRFRPLAMLLAQDRRPSVAVRQLLQGSALVRSERSVNLLALCVSGIANFVLNERVVFRKKNQS